ncbi:Molybdopterin-guanine dinucleotide biosynthesis protein A [Lutibacter agarilyticus]|uniref:Molybdopterin-guanine dinucleotide biosynthesis protein A n=1 Tax=Lutibacter agarilyticus TaxID=1109740 RepID=A0A238VSK9_9FLAO|nr:NTP transferase domain-containing protein [Lutibacter agarilyticus]SNR37228.1 Molybdopterin-guanine dinucleotide biosynthesis protein A [Lutibacter agarilyticus]
MGKHQKHAKLKLRDNDNFAPNEISIVGTNCSNISKLVLNISEQLSNYKLAYFDASHAKNSEDLTVETYTFHHKGTAAISVNAEVNKFNQRVKFSQYDYVFINGNHYQGAKQILILDPEKEASVLKRLEQLDNIQFVIKLKEDATYFDFLEAHNPQIKNLLCYHINEVEKISKHIENLIQEKIAPIQGLVLAGGKSIRMGTDKGQLNFYGKSQRDVAIELLEKNNLKTYLSVRKEQDVSTAHKITDKFIGLGPFGAICSAFQENPDVAWLVIATDLPFLTNEVIQLLLKHRNPSKVATTIKGKNKQFPEPLITIWEPKSYTLLLNYLAQGYSCPRKVLINSEVEIIEIEDDLIRNINTPEEFKTAYKEINE